MRKVLVAAVMLSLMVGPAASSSIESQIARDCPTDYEPVISMAAPNQDYSNPGPPGFYEYDLCVQGIREATIASSCEKNAGFYLSSNKSTAHFSEFSSYNMRVCTGRMLTDVRNSCRDNQTKLFSVSSNDNAHAAAPGVFDKEVCGFYAAPRNITLSMKFNISSSDRVYVDDTEVGEKEIRLAEFPYIVSEGDSYIAGIVANDMISVERKLEQRNRLIMERQQGEFILPFTQGSRRDIEEHQQDILGGEFLGLLEPSFGYFIPEEATVRTSLGTDIEIDSSISIGRGSHRLKITKIGENKIRIEKE